MKKSTVDLGIYLVIVAVIAFSYSIYVIKIQSDEQATLSPGEHTLALINAEIEAEKELTTIREKLNDTADQTLQELMNYRTYYWTRTPEQIKDPLKEFMETMNSKLSQQAGQEIEFYYLITGDKITAIASKPILVPIKTEKIRIGTHYYRPTITTKLPYDVEAKIKCLQTLEHEKIQDLIELCKDSEDKLLCSQDNTLFKVITSSRTSEEIILLRKPFCWTES